MLFKKSHDLGHRSILCCGLAMTLLLSSSSRAEETSPEQFQQQLEQENAQLVHVVNQLNQLNPFSQASPMPVTATGQAGQATPVGGMSPEVFAEIDKQLERARVVLDNPYVKKGLRVFSDPSVVRDAGALAANQDSKKFLYFELGWIVFTFLFRASILSRTRGILKILFAQAWTFVFFLFGGSYLLPRFVYGDAFQTLVHDLVRAFQQ